MSIIDFSDTIIAKSDQLNASDIAGSITIKIADAKKLQDPDQPIHIFYEGGGNKPWKPCKTMRRVIAQVWGSKVDLKGRSITLVCDPKVTWGGAEVGGIRLTHMSHMAGGKQVVLPVRVSRHKVEKYVVLPLATDTKPVASIEPETLLDTDALYEAGKEAALGGVESYLAWRNALEPDEIEAVKSMNKELSKLAKESEENDELPI
jgi:hypothetical protein